MSSLYNEILGKDPRWHHEEYPSITIEEVGKGQGVDGARKNELIEWAYCELRLLSAERDGVKNLYNALLKKYDTQSAENKSLRALYEATVEYVESDEDDISGIMAAFSELYGPPASTGLKPDGT